MLFFFFFFSKRLCPLCQSMYKYSWEAEEGSCRPTHYQRRASIMSIHRTGFQQYWRWSPGESSGVERLGVGACGRTSSAHSAALQCHCLTPEQRGCVEELNKIKWPWGDGSRKSECPKNFIAYSQSLHTYSEPVYTLLTLWQRYYSRVFSRTIWPPTVNCLFVHFHCCSTIRS